jgi:hypothetical protein
MKVIKAFFKIIKWIIYLILLLTILYLIIHFILNIFIRPSNNHNWNDDQSVLPYAEINNNLVTIHNIRNFQYKTITDYTRNYYDKTFDLNKLQKVWYVVEPFSGIPGSAHTFLSFEFENDEFVSISVEIRKEKGETYSPIKGLLNQYELMYVVADEKDVIKLRTNYRKDQVFLYPVETTKDKVREVFLDMINRANELRKNPEFYNTLTNTCTTNIVKHVNTVTPSRIPFLNLRILFPANSDILAKELGLLDVDKTLPIEKLREKYNINTKALKYSDDPEFSARIREK